MEKSTYNTSLFWEWALAHHDVWQGLFMDAKRISRPVFLNTTIIKAGAIYDNNWACYPDIYAALGFVQHVFLPAIFHLSTHPENDRIYIPVCSTEAHLENLLALQTPEGERMAAALQTMAGLWEMEPESLMEALSRFCRDFCVAWSDGDSVMHIELFPSTYGVHSFLRDIFWADEVFCEDIGTTPREFEQFCGQFYREPTSREMFIRFLNHRVGCVV